MDELRRPGIPDEADEVALLQVPTDLQPGRGGVEVTEEEHVVAELAPLPERVARDDGGAEEGADEDDLGVALLVLERDHGDGRPLLLGEVDRAVADMAEAPAAALALVGAVEVVAADDARVRAGDRVAVGVVVGGALGTSRDLVVDDPPAALVVVGVGLRLGLGPVVIARETHARVAVGDGVDGAERGREGALRGGGGGVDVGCDVHRRAVRRACPEREQRDEREGRGLRRHQVIVPVRPGHSQLCSAPP